ncbi:MAG: AAA family ATPase, partial [Bacteroidales bacterium]|nr:AAA family ATPase [Bacteroidales bacterium]
REKAGFSKNPPRLHTAIIGNPGTGKTKAVELMASLYKSLGLLDTDEIWTTRVSTLATSGINSENEAVANAVNDAMGGTLVIDGAHELYRTDNKGNYDTESRIIRALVDCLNNKEKYGRWMLVLVGEPEGMESLLSGYPDLRKCLSDPIYMEDFKPEELFEMFDICCMERKIRLSDEARKKLEMYVLHKYNRRGPGFTNAWLVQTLFDDSIIPAMFNRLSGIMRPRKKQLETVLPEDIPSVGEQKDDAMAELDELIGLGKIKTKVKDFLYSIKLARRRMELGLPTDMPRLHMAFLGNPGTGKTTVAEIIGKVFASWGILSGGRVIRTEKSQMVGQFIGETEFKMTNLLARARGNILFIDEAYQLVEGGEKDHGRIVMNSLLTELGKDNLDMVVIMAGYTAPMKRLLESNEGIESRFPNVFNFEDYTTDELLEIGKLMIRKQGFTLTEGAAENMRQIIQEESDKPSPRFGNGRFINNLLQNEILATLGARTAKLKNPTKEDLSTILPEDVVVGKAQKDVVFDDVAIDAALAKLDSLAGLNEVKIAVHDFVSSARYLHSIGEPYVGKGLLSWRFVGNSGTGKSTVAEIMAQILKGMRLIASSHITEIKGERIFGVSELDCDTVLKEAVKRACNGLIFIDVDDPKFTSERTTYARYAELIRLKVKELTVEAGGECALILAELDSPNAAVSEQLYEAGVYEFDHTLVFRDFTPEELFGILEYCLRKYKVSFSDEAREHMLHYLTSMRAHINANARTMKLLSRAIYQKVILRESTSSPAPDKHIVELADVKMLKWDGKKGKIGF